MSSIRQRVVLTFDDGPGPSTPALLDVLARGGVCATFFLLGRNVEAMPEVATRIAREGHALGNHTFSHTRPSTIASESLTAEITRTDRLLEEAMRAAGVPVPRSFPVRLPYGPAPGDPRVGVLATLGRPHVHWTAAFEDWSTNTRSSDLAHRMRAHVEAQRARGADAVLDLHDSSRRAERRDATVEAVRTVIDELRAAAFIRP